MQPIVRKIQQELDSGIFQTAYDAGQSLTGDEALAEIRERFSSA